MGGQQPVPLCFELQAEGVVAGASEEIDEFGEDAHVTAKGIVANGGQPGEQDFVDAGVGEQVVGLQRRKNRRSVEGREQAIVDQELRIGSPKKQGIEDVPGVFRGGDDQGTIAGHDSSEEILGDVL